MMKYSWQCDVIVLLVLMKKCTQEPPTFMCVGLKLSTQLDYLRVSKVHCYGSEYLTLILRIVGIGSDGASTNNARGLKGLVESQCEWIFWMWCLAHRLQLAVKDALKGTGPQ